MQSSSYSAPSSPIRKKPVVLKGFRATPKPKERPLNQLSLRELHDKYDRNEKTLASPSTSVHVERISAEQVALKRLIEVDGISKALKDTKIVGDDAMNVDETGPPVFNMISAKQRALARYASASIPQAPGSLSLQEAIEIEQRAHAADAERHRRNIERKQRMGLPVKGETLTKEQREARIWAFMNYKPTESDLDDDSDDEEEEEEEDDPASWFVDEQEGGIKGQEIIEPDDFSDIIRVDEQRSNGYSQYFGD